MGASEAPRTFRLCSCSLGDLQMGDQEARGGSIYLQGRVCILGVLRLPGFSWIEWPLPKIEGLGLKLLSNS